MPTANAIIEIVTKEVAYRSADYSAAELVIYYGTVIGPSIPPVANGAGLGSTQRASLRSDLSDWIETNGGNALAGTLDADLTIRQLENLVGSKFNPAVTIP